MTPGDLIAQRRAELGESLAIFSKRLGVDRSFLCDVEHGKRRVALKHAQRWAEPLGIEPAALAKLIFQELLDEAGLDLVVQVRRR